MARVLRQIMAPCNLNGMWLKALLSRNSSTPKSCAGTPLLIAVKAVRVLPHSHPKLIGSYCLSRAVQITQGNFTADPDCDQTVSYIFSSEVLYFLT